MLAAQRIDDRLSDKAASATAGHAIEIVRHCFPIQQLQLTR